MPRKTLYNLQTIRNFFYCSKKITIEDYAQEIWIHNFLLTFAIIVVIILSVFEMGNVALYITMQ